MITSKLYNNTILAPIREYSTNAIDACLAAHKPVHFDVTLPTVENCVFAVRDYGTGLSKEDINTLFSTLGASTKRDSNLYNGTFGIGRMAGLAYTQHSFTIESYYNGHHSSYLLTTKKGELGIVELSSVPTSEPTGLKLSFPVKHEHISNFHAEAKKLYRFFDYKPKLNIDLDISTPKSTHLSTDYFMLEEYSYNNYVLMSNVLYKIESSSLINEKGLTGVVLKVPNGEVTYSPNRESLILDEETVAYLNTKFDYVYNDLLSTVTTTLTAATTVKEYAKLFLMYNNSMPYRLRNSFDIDWSGIISKMFTKSTFNAFVSTIPNVEVFSWGSYYSGFKLSPLESIDYLYNANVIIVDQKTRFRDAALSLHNSKSLVFKCTDPVALAALKQQLTDQGYSYDLTSEHTAPDLRSTPKKAKRSPSAMPYVCYYEHCKFVANRLATSNLTYLYVPLIRYKSSIKNFDAYRHTLSVYTNTRSSFTYKNKTYDLSNCRLVGVQKAYQKAAKDLDNFLPLVDVLDVIHKDLSLYTYPPRELGGLVDCPILPSKLAQRVKDLTKFSALSNNTHPEIASLIATVYPDVPYTNYEYTDSTDDLYKVYPMLHFIADYRSKYLSYYTELEYIHEQSKNNKTSEQYSSS